MDFSAKNLVNASVSKPTEDSFAESILLNVNYSTISDTLGLFLALIALVLNFFVFQTARCMPDQSTSTRLMSFLAVWDTLSLSHDGIFVMGFNAFGVDLQSLHKVVCKISEYHSWGSTINASMHLSVLAVDRALCIKFPIWYRRKTTENAARNFSICCTLFSYFIVIPNLFIFTVEKSECTMGSLSRKPIFIFYQLFVSYVVFAVGPFILVGSSNLVFIKERRKFQKRTLRRIDVKVTFNKTKLGSDSTNDSLLCSHINSTFNCEKLSPINDKKKDYDAKRMITRNDAQLIAMLRFVSCFYLTVTATAVILSSYAYVHRRPQNHPREKELALSLAKLMTVLNNSINFIFYYIAGPVFRTTFKQQFFRLSKRICKK